MRHSFRVRTILLSVGVSGLVLAVFALSAWAFVHRIALERIDRELAQRMAPILVVPHPPEHWPWIADGLDLSYGGDRGPGCLLLVKAADGQVLHQSADWPSDLPADGFPAPDAGDPGLRRFPQPPRMPQARGPAPGGRPGAAPPEWTFLPVTRPDFVTRRTHRGTLRLCIQRNPEVTVVAGLRLAAFEGEMARVRTAFTAALPAALLLIALGSWLLSRRTLRSLEDLADVAERVTASSLDQRVPTENVETELRRLVAVLNGMLDRLQRSFDQAVRFSADAAHELRTPLTILQGAIEQALQATPAGSDQQRTYNDLLEEVHRLKAITQKLLLLSQADSGELHPTLRRLELTELVAETVEDARALAPLLTVTDDLSPDVYVMADRDLLEHALTNLSGNAVKYNRERGSVNVRLTADNGVAEIVITNTGPGIPPEDYDRLFERFYRADPSRGRRVDGVGLGLSIAREIARAHGGNLVLVESRNEQTTFRMTLPVADPLPADAHPSPPVV